MLVLIHHSVIAYTYFGHTDPQSFLGFDGVVLFNDSFFMAAMFFLSGLFVWPSLQRKGIGWFLRDRWWRLGLPFIVCALVVMPLAYYAVDLRRIGPEQLHGVLVEDRHRRPLAERAGLVRLGAAGARCDRGGGVPRSARMRRCDRPVVAARALRGPGCFSGRC